MAWLVTGGAGYIGAHVVHAFRQAGRKVVVLDDLSSGFEEFLPADVPLVKGRVEDLGAVSDALDRTPIEGVIHLAGLKYAGESVAHPLDFFRVNTEGTRVLLSAMQQRGVDRFVFSSSCSVYGTVPDAVPVTESASTRPESPYGESKLVAEWIVRAHAQARASFRHTSLRYFNVVGSGDLGVADHSPFNLFPLAFRALGRGEAPVIFGDDYATRDGTCVRDYIHVEDLAAAHVQAAFALETNRSVAPSYNVGRGSGVTVREIFDAMYDSVGRKDRPPPRIAARRPGDPASIVADSSALVRDLGWNPQHALRSMVDSAWNAWNAPASAQREGGP